MVVRIGHGIFQLQGHPHTVRALLPAKVFFNSSQGETKSVLEYFALCAKFWERKEDRLELWKAAVELGEIPDFGTNIRYFF